MFASAHALGPFNDLNQDCLQNVLSFESPLEMWTHRETSPAWHDAATIALRQVLHVEWCGRDDCACADSHCDIRLLIDICPNVETLGDSNWWSCMSELQVIKKKFGLGARGS